MPVGSSKDLQCPNSDEDALSRHERTICAFDLDNFYVACERLKNPSLCGLPVGIQQKASWCLYYGQRLAKAVRLFARTFLRRAPTKPEREHNHLSKPRGTDELHNL